MLPSLTTYTHMVERENQFLLTYTHINTDTNTLNICKNLFHFTQALQTGSLFSVFFQQALVRSLAFLSLSILGSSPFHTYLSTSHSVGVAVLWDTRRRLSHWFFLKGALKLAWNEKVLNDAREEIARAPGTEERTICWGIARMASWKRSSTLKEFGLGHVEAKVHTTGVP